LNSERKRLGLPGLGLGTLATDSIDVSPKMIGNQSNLLDDLPQLSPTQHFLNVELHQSGPALNVPTHFVDLKRKKKSRYQSMKRKLMADILEKRNFS
jgi:hypothetical protein